jgi:hypothetical protein
VGVYLQIAISEPRWDADASSNVLLTRVFKGKEGFRNVSCDVATQTSSPSCAFFIRRIALEWWRNRSYTAICIWIFAWGLYPSIVKCSYWKSSMLVTSGLILKNGNGRGVLQNNIFHHAMYWSCSWLTLKRALPFQLLLQWFNMIEIHMGVANDVDKFSSS